MVAAVQRHEAGAVDQGRDLPALVQGNPFVVARVQNQRLAADFRREMADVEIPDLAHQARCVRRRG